MTFWYCSITACARGRGAQLSDHRAGSAARHTIPQQHGRRHPSQSAAGTRTSTCLSASGSSSSISAVAYRSSGGSSPGVSGGHVYLRKRQRLAGRLQAARPAHSEAAALVTGQQLVRGGRASRTTVGGGVKGLTRPCLAHQPRPGDRGTEGNGEEGQPAAAASCSRREEVNQQPHAAAPTGGHARGAVRGAVRGPARPR